MASSENRKEKKAAKLIDQALELMESAILEEICDDFFHGKAFFRCDGKRIEVFHSVPKKNGQERDGLKSHWIKIETLSAFYFMCEGEQRRNGFNAIIEAFESEAARLRKHINDKPTHPPQQ